MAGVLHEWYGYLATDGSTTAAVSARNKECPFLAGPCTKAGGVCSVTPAASQEHVVICPERMKFDGHEFLRRIALEAWDAAFPLPLEADGLPALLPGSAAKAHAVATTTHTVGVFGKSPFGSEVKLPSAVPGGARYSVDFVIVIIDPLGELVAFTPVELQTIDTTSSYAASLTAIASGRQVVQSGFGLNWENVNKRILPQLIVKGLMLQGERLCASGMYFVTPQPVFARILARLGGPSRLREIPLQPGSTTFWTYEFESDPPPGSVATMKVLTKRTISTSDLSLAFITPENLPPAGSYEVSINAKL